MLYLDIFEGKPKRFSRLKEMKLEKGIKVRYFALVYWEYFPGW